MCCVHSHDAVVACRAARSGDPDQSIYSWRHASASNLAQLRKRFEGRVLQVNLEQNYRSTPEILGVSQRVIARDTSREKKDLWTDNAKGGPVRLHLHADQRAEAVHVAQHVAGVLGLSCRLPNERRSSDQRGSLGGGAKARSVPPTLARGRAAAASGVVSCAVLFRTGAQARVLEETLVLRGVPFRVAGGTRFYERAEIKLLLSYLRVAANPADETAIKATLNVPPRGIGDKSRDWLLRAAQPPTAAAHDAAEADAATASGSGTLLSFLRRGSAAAAAVDAASAADDAAPLSTPPTAAATARVAKDAPLWRTLQRVARSGRVRGAQHAPPQLREAARRYVDVVSAAAEMIERAAGVQEVLQLLADRVELQSYITKTWKADAAERLENVRELLASAGEVDEAFSAPLSQTPSDWTQGSALSPPARARSDIASPGAMSDVPPSRAVDAFLERVALASDSGVQAGEGGAGAQVTLSTVHSAKGLEWDAVHVVGVEDGLLPHDNSLRDDAGPAKIAEERRLLFVAMTRAKMQLHLHRCIQRQFNGRVRARAATA